LEVAVADPFAKAGLETRAALTWAADESARIANSDPEAKAAFEGLLRGLCMGVAFAAVNPQWAEAVENELAAYLAWRKQGKRDFARCIVDSTREGTIPYGQSTGSSSLPT
jgi:hypothetical protein